MIRVLHFADLHLGIENYGRINPATGLHTRVEDFLRAFDRVIDHALEEQVDAVLFAGDAYKTKDPTVTLQREFAKRLERLIQANIPTVLLTGNHDLPISYGRANSLDIFHALQLKPIYVVSHPSTIVVPTKAGPLQVVCVPWLHRGRFVQGESIGERPANEELAEMGDTVENWLTSVLELELDTTLPTVALVHATVRGASVGSERQLLLGNDLELTAASLDQPYFDYVALGHVHKAQVIPGQRPIRYAGSLERVDFGEEGEPKGYILAEVERGSARTRFVPWAARPFLTIKVKLDALGTTADVVAEIERRDLTDAVVRIQIEGPAAVLKQLRAPEIIAATRSAYAFAGISQRSEEERRAQELVDILSGRSLDQVLEQYLNSRNVAATRRQRLLSAAQELIAEEAHEQ